MEIAFTINGKPYKAADSDDSTPSSTPLIRKPTNAKGATRKYDTTQKEVSGTRVPVDTSLNTFIRNYAYLSGTKFMCLEGGCGVCIVTLRGVHPVTKEKKTWAVNSCLFPVFSCHDLEITTVEGVGDKRVGYHPIQTRLAHLNGTQCGYCSPGMVMNMYSLLESKSEKISMEEIENSFGGNICRCTGYRPILDAFKGLATDACEELQNMAADIEDIYKICPKSGSKCKGQCKPPEQNQLAVEFVDNREWHKVYNVASIFDIFSKIGSRPYMLVAGNTAHGVYRRDPKIEVFIDVNAVEELRAYTIDKSVVLSGNVNLTETMEIFAKAANSHPEFEYLRELIKHIDLIANVPVRNAGTIAGNLSIKNQHNEFPSDMFLILETAGAKVTVASAPGETKEMSILEFSTSNMDKKVLLKVTLPSLPAPRFAYRSYKIMPRAQNAHAYVNAGFLVEFNDKRDKVTSARICFGGIDPKFTHASATEKLVIGKDLSTNETLRSIFNSLNSEISPDWVLPDASPEFRKNLAMSLCYKFLINICPAAKLNPAFLSGGAVLSRNLSTGKQVFDTYKDKYPLTEPVPKLEAISQCSGEAKYINDIPYQPGEVWAAFVHATEVHSVIGQIDASEALKIPGVVAFYSAKDIPGVNNFSPPKFFLMVEVEPVFCAGEVQFNGQPAGVIVAESFAVANYAAKFVKIIYEKQESNIMSSLIEYVVGSQETKKQILPTLADVLNSPETDRIITAPPTLAASEGLMATHKLSGHFAIGSQYHYTMEAQTCVCVPNEDSIDVHSASQWMDIVQAAVAYVLNIQENKVNVEVRRIGGGYGGKISRNLQVACAAALASHLLNRPVRFVLTIESNMTTAGKRYACNSDYAVEVDDNGKIQKLKNEFFIDSGCSMNESLIGFVPLFFKNSYDNATYTLQPKSVKTDAPSHTWCRAPGTTEAIAMIENIMEHIARVTNKEPEEVRKVNMLDSNPIKKLYIDFLKSVDYDTRKKEINSFNTQNRWRKRGISVVPMEYPCDYLGNMQAQVSIYHGDGTVIVSHGGIEMGQGINTKAAQIAAHILGISLDMVTVKPSNNVTGANSMVTGGSVASETVGFAIKKACEMLLERMKPVKASMKDAKWPAIAEACYQQQIDLTASYLCKRDDIQPYLIYGCTCAEVEVDLLTGNLLINRIDLLEDTGESMSPLVDVGQVEGAFIMGLGYWLTESLIYQRQNGELLTTRTWNYKPPGVKDIPIDFRVTFLQKSSNPRGVLRSKATGEPSFCMAVVVIFALRHALDSARKDAGLKEKWYELGAPSTPETVILMSGSAIDQFQLK